MSEAAIWEAVCGTRVTAGFRSLSEDPWCRSLLSDAAVAFPRPVGADGWVWTFPDGSQLIANSQSTLVRERSGV